MVLYFPPYEVPYSMLQFLKVQDEIISVKKSRKLDLTDQTSRRLNVPPQIRASLNAIRDTLLSENVHVLGHSQVSVAQKLKTFHTTPPKKPITCYLILSLHTSNHEHVHILRRYFTQFIITCAVGVASQ